MTSSSRQPRRSTWVIGIASAMAMIAPFSMDIYFPSLTSIRDEFLLSDSYLQLSVSLYLWGFGFSQLFVGVLSDRLGRKPTFAFGMILFVAASIGCALSESFEAFLIFRVFQSAGACVGAVTSLAIARDLFAGKERARVISYISSVMAIAPIVAPIIGGFFEEHFEWHMSFFFLAALGTLMLLLLNFLDETNQSRTPLSWASIFRDYLVIVRHRHWIRSATLSTLHFSAFFAWLAASPVYYVGYLNLSPSAFSLVFGATAFAFMSGAFLNTQLLKKKTEEFVLGLGTLILFLGGLGFVMNSWLSPSVLGLWLSGSLCALGLGFVMPTTFSAAMEPFGHMAGKASALLNVFRLGISGAIVSLTSFFYTESGLGIALAILTLALAQALVWSLTKPSQS